jgi:hypothetical protein
VLSLTGGITDLPSIPDNVEPAALTTVLDGRWAQLRQEVRAQMAGAEVKDGSDLSTEEYRRQVLEDLHLLAKTSHAQLGFAREYGGMGDPAGSVVAHEMLGYGDLSLMVKAGVQWGLFGGAVQLLGTRPRHERYLRDIMDVTLPGCFAMTETGWKQFPGWLVTRAPSFSRAPLGCSVFGLGGSRGDGLGWSPGKGHNDTTAPGFPGAADRQQGDAPQSAG